MSKSIQARYERGVFKPLHPVDYAEGQDVVISVETLALTPAQADAQLSGWGAVYAGLTGEEVAEIERLALDRSHFVPDREEAK
jgi:predicted DNA-binding antitoxin AbrB/MazE fold protein